MLSNGGLNRQEAPDEQENINIEVGPDHSMDMMGHLIFNALRNSLTQNTETISIDIQNILENPPIENPPIENASSSETSDDNSTITEEDTQM